jgi:hypothetical protein
MTILDLIRLIIFIFDLFIYSLVTIMYDFIFELAGLEIFSSAELGKFANNIYAILAVFMLFRLSFIVLNMIVNPDVLVDQKKGFGSILVKSMTALVLIVAIPMAFGYAMRLQKTIVENNIFMKLFMGTTQNDAEAGEYLSIETLLAFVNCNPEATGGCTIDGTRDKLRDGFQMTKEINKKDSRGLYIYTYYPIISTATGIFILVLTLTFSIDIALRTVKLGFLQIIAPVAVISYVDPKSSEQGFFKRWVDLCISTYLMLFIRLAAIAFMIYVLSRLPVMFPS